MVVSRSHPGLVRCLFELEVPEIAQGIIEFKGISREAGSRSKIAVASTMDNVDPVGTCIGPKGMRVQNVIDELRGEKIETVKGYQQQLKSCKVGETVKVKAMRQGTEGYVEVSFDVVLKSR